MPVFTILLSETKITKEGSYIPISLGPKLNDELDDNMFIVPGWWPGTGVFPNILM